MTLAGTQDHAPAVCTNDSQAATQDLADLQRRWSRSHERSRLTFTIQDRQSYCKIIILYKLKQSVV